MHEITPIILAAGLSSRFEEGHKLAYQISGEAMLNKTIENTLAAFKDKPIVVCNERTASIVKKSLRNQVIIVDQRSPQKGMLSSIKLALQELKEVNGFAIVLADMPFIKARDFKDLIKLFESHNCQRVTLPEIDGRPGHPVIFPFSYKSKAMNLPDSDQGLRALIRFNENTIATLKSCNLNYLRDIDRITDL